MFLAIISDLKEERIPNSLILAGWFLGAVYQILFYGMIEAAFGCLGALVPIVVLFLFFLFKMLGAGDIKLLSVVGMFYGVEQIGAILVWTFFTGAFISLGVLCYRRIMKERFLYFWSYLCGREGLHHREGQVDGKRIYYDRKRDGDKPMIHFSLAVAGGVLLWEKFGFVF